MVRRTALAGLAAAWFGGALTAGHAALAIHAAPSTDAAASADAEMKLSVVRTRIAQLTARVAQELAQRDAQSARLRAAELNVTASRQKLDGLRAAQLAANRHLTTLRAEQQKSEHALDAERATLAAQVRAAYMMGGQAEIKLFLNQGSPASAARMLAYYGYFARRRSAQIEDIRTRVQRAAEVIGEIERTNAHLAALVSDAQREMQSLEAARQERAQSLAALAERVSGGNQELEQLKHQEQALQALVEDLARVMQDFPVDSQQPFSQLKGKLPWPVPGHLAARFQEARAVADSGARWNGIMIETAHGAKVRTPYFGRVVYADWLQGVGLLMIIGHNGGYMTLYGHAEVLYKSVGDWVSPGDVIAGMSDTGSAAPQLYFEIREGRRTVDPKNWLKAAP